MKKFAALTLLSLLLSGCVTTGDKVAAVTSPAVFIKSDSPQIVINKITELCDRRGLMIDESVPNGVTCSMEGSFMAQAFLGTAYGTPVRGCVRFNAFPVKGSGIKVVGNAWHETQNAFGQTQKIQTNAANTRESMQSLMNEAKAELEMGKTP